MSGRALVIALAAGAATAGCTIDTRVATFRGDAAVIKSDGASNGDGALTRFSLVPAGAPLPTGATCARLVRSMPEQEPSNVTYNARATTPAEVAKLDPWDMANEIFDPAALTLQARLTGDFTGTTDELLQWVACKWGFDEDYLRAEAYQQSTWRQRAHGDWLDTPDPDCPPNADTQTMNGTPQCAQTYGMLQVMWKYHKSAWPMFRDSTPFHLDFVYGLRRVCFEGWDTGQASRAPVAGKPYMKNDYMGCLGAHFSGQWYDDEANAYISRVLGQLQGRAWEQLGFKP
jgi:autotransporter family porin